VLAGIVTRTGFRQRAVRGHAVDVSHGLVSVLLALAKTK
jgi:hypothetical protein